MLLSRLALDSFPTRAETITWRTKKHNTTA